MNFTNSIAAFNEAVKHIPGGVNSPVRAFKSVKGSPIFIDSAHGSKITDIDGNEYIDYVGSWGPMILGHTHPEVVKAIQETAIKGASFGAPTGLETRMAKQIKKMVPSIEIVRMVNSGTEATMSALRLARGYTHRDLVIKFEGCYHGHADSFLIHAGSGALTLGQPNSPGVTEGTAKDTLLAKYNRLDTVTALFEKFPEKIAAVIVEPVPGNMGLVVPQQEFLQGLRDLCTQYGAVLIFDEVMCGFRVAKGGAQERFNITPDLTTLGKIIGGGLPVGAYGGRKEIMDELSPNGPVYQAGTLSGNPLAMAAGLKTLELIDKPGFYETLEEKSNLLVNGLRGVVQKLGFPAIINQVGSMFTLFFTNNETIDTFDASAIDAAKYGKYFHLSLESGIYLAPSQFEAGFMSIAHTTQDIEKTIEATENALKKML